MTVHSDSTGADVTILIVASPIPTHPRTSVLDGAIASLPMLQTEGLPPVIIAHDAPRPGAPRRVLRRYRRYLARIQERYESSRRFKVVVASEWGCLAGNIANGLRHVGSEFVLVLQHDFRFVQEISLDRLVQMMKDFPHVRHLRFNKNLNRAKEWDGNFEGFFKEMDVGGIKVCRTAAWSDNPHLCRKDYYTDFVLPLMAGEKTFPEEVLNPRARPENHAEHGTYVYGAFRAAPTVDFVDGRNLGDYSMRRWKNSITYRVNRIRGRVLLRTRLRQILKTRCACP